MNESEARNPAARQGLEALRRFTRTQPPAERCELCGATLEAEHPHLLEWKTRRVSCACRACALLFCDQQGGRYARLPQRVARLTDFAFSDVDWEEMMLPIGLAFFIRREGGSMAAFYPSPAGVVESLISLDSWTRTAGAHPVLTTMEPELEALLVNRVAGEPQYFLVPLDECYRLAGVIRQQWRGLSGGPGLWGAVASFFDELRRRARPTGQVRYA
ncbi:MAG TPA: DUF5947 family protein [Acidobacteriaceae bacterium]|jgi:hypothetical protein|nr:DUF5947 family protein [Acidobacteriaceae bacterium]